jgi:SAM-dependent methyltransferase
MGKKDINSEIKKRKFPEPKIIDKLHEYIYKTGIFRAGLEMNIWDKVAKGWDTAEKIAANENWDPPGTRILLDDLCSLKLLIKRNNRYHLVKEAKCFLLSDKPTYEGKFLINEFHWEGDGLLAETIRTGKRPIHYNAIKDEMIDVWIEMYVSRLTDVDNYLKISSQLWKELAIQPHSGMRVLDVACGPAPLTLALARQNSGVLVTLVDWERILITALNFACKLGVEKQVTIKKGDLWITDFGQNQFDLAFLGNITHFFSPEENIRLFEKTYEALNPAGVIAIDAIRHEYPLPSDPELWYYALSRGGAAYDFEQYRNMLERAGFTSVQDVAKQPIRAIKL